MSAEEPPTDLRRAVPVEAGEGEDAPPLDAGLDPTRLVEACLALTREAARCERLDALGDAIGRTAAALLGADQATLGLLEGDEVVTVAALYPRRLPTGSRFPVGFGVAGWVAATGRSAEIADVRQDRRYVALPYPEVRSFVGMPLAVDGQLLGVLSLAARRPGAFPAGSADALAPFTELAALCLKHMLAREELAARLATLETDREHGLAETLHELKAPLSGMAGLMEIVASGQAGPLTDQQRDFLETAKAESKRVRTLITRLLEEQAGARMAAGRRALVEPARLATEAIRRVRGQAIRDGVRLALHAEDELPRIAVVPEAVQQVFANLLQNALRHAPHGSVVTVSAVELGEWVCFMVADEGPGFGSQDTERLFGRFEQGALAEGVGGGNVGLGLWIARRIVEAHGGRIWAENRERTGARCCFALPLPRHAPAAEAPPVES